MPAPLISVRDIGKSFEGTHALSGVDLDIAPGTIHALVGENGAGKSTLGKILAGVYGPDAGTIRLDSREVSFQSPRDALAHGITIVAQEIALVGTRSVIENIYLGSEVHTGPFVRTKRLRRLFDELVADTGIDVPGDALVSGLSIADQQKVEILRALARNADVIVMDEPTARLATHEAEALMSIFDRLRGRGKTIIFVSHFLEEVLSVSDTVTVLRDGKIVDGGKATEFTPGSLIAAMIGRSLESAFPPKAAISQGRPVLSVAALSRAGAFEDVSLDVDAGEIVVITGLVGSGRSEVLRSIYGLEPPTSGAITYKGEPAQYRHPRQAIAAGMALIPESRKTEGLFVGFSLVSNVSLPHLPRFSRAGFVRARAAHRSATEQMAAVGVKARSATVEAGLLSGGNQQKILFARSFMADIALLLADEPTRGVDVAAKRQIYDLLVQQAANGTGVLLVSSEMEEVIGLAHKVVVMRQGRVVGQLRGSDIRESAIAELAFGQTTQA
jgi:simple sugar transport system ATP-binding protein/ribose transport system ATP-binding protein